MAALQRSPGSLKCDVRGDGVYTNTRSPTTIFGELAFDTSGFLFRRKQLIRHIQAIASGEEKFVK
jgi:hypothetical protein